MSQLIRIRSRASLKSMVRGSPEPSCIDPQSAEFALHFVRIARSRDRMHSLLNMTGPEVARMESLYPTLLRLLLAGGLGGIIGLERTIHHKSAGIRTNMF